VTHRPCQNSLSPNEPLVIGDACEGLPAGRGEALERQPRSYRAAEMRSCRPWNSTAGGRQRAELQPLPIWRQCVGGAGHAFLSGPYFLRNQCIEALVGVRAGLIDRLLVQDQILHRLADELARFPDWRRWGSRLPTSPSRPSTSSAACHCCRTGSSSIHLRYSGSLATEERGGAMAPAPPSSSARPGWSPHCTKYQAASGCLL